MAEPGHLNGRISLSTDCGVPPYSRLGATLFGVDAFSLSSLVAVDLIVLRLS